MKKILALLLALVMVFALCACGQQAAPAPADKPAEAAPAPADKPAEAAPAAAAGTLKIWVAEAIVDFTKDQVAKFVEAHPEYAGYEVTVEPVGEGDAASNMLTDVEAGADIFGFPQDQLARLVAADALIELSEENAALVAAENDAGSVAAATMAGTVYAFPLTSDNGYFMYYDKSVISDPSNLEAIIADCEKAGKSFYFDLRSGWYQPAFFFGAGCTLTYDTDDAGAFTNCNIDYASENGVGAMKALIALAKSPAFVNGSSVSNATNAAAIIDGTWDADAAKEMFGENYACAKRPTVKINGVDTQLGGFGGFKLLGVKPQTDEAKLAFCDDLAAYLASGEVQLARYNVVFWGPSNIAAKADPAVQADEALSALGQQLAFTVPQGQYPGEYWSLAEALGDDIIGGKYNDADDAALLAALQTFQDTCIGYAG